MSAVQQQFAKGDRVKVTLEGEVTGIVPFGDRVELCVTDDSGNRYFIVPDSGNVEKVEPPVEVFGPGSVVRNKLEGSLWAIGTDGYLRLGDSGYVTVRSSIQFTSEDYERVSVG